MNPIGKTISNWTENTSGITVHYSDGSKSIINSLSDNGFAYVKVDHQKYVNEKWFRVRFHANMTDYRPITFPPVGPFWCSGYSPTHAILVAYVKEISQVSEFWPEAINLEVINENCDIEFSSRFQKPSWWKGGE